MSAQATLAHRASLVPIAREGEGRFRLRTARMNDTLALLLAARQGDRVAVLLTQAFSWVFHAVRHTHASGRRPYCASCGEAYTAAGTANLSLVAVLPDVENPTQAAILPICTPCAPTPEAFEAKAREVVDQLWPEARAAIEPTARGAA